MNIRDHYSLFIVAVFIHIFSAGPQDFVMSTPSPYLPSRSPKHGILKVSPGNKATPPSHLSTTGARKSYPLGTEAAKGTNSMPEGGSSPLAGQSLRHNGNKFADKARSGKRKDKSPKFASKKKGGRVKKPKHH